jgi:RNA polymerase sigma factor (TIGR02999 family)
LIYMADVTRMIEEVGRGDTAAAAELLPVVYEELRRLARGHMAHERAGHTLGATALVHEAYVRLLGSGGGAGAGTRWDHRGHFFAAAAEAMRRILIEHARRKQAAKYGGRHDRVAMVEDELPPIAAPCAEVTDLLALDEALDRLAAEDPRRAELVKMLYFAGLSLGEAAAALGISRTAAHRQWVFARAWLHDAMVGRASGGRTPR